MSSPPELQSNTYSQLQLLDSQAELPGAKLAVEVESSGHNETGVRQTQHPTRLWFLPQARQAESVAPGDKSFDYEKIYDEDAYGEEADLNARVWKVYDAEADMYDQEQIAMWREVQDVLLVFIGLFSAVVATFVVQTSLTLQPDYQQITAILTYELLRAMANSTNNIPVTITAEDPRTAVADPSPVDNIVNVLWFTSLAVSLSAALLTVLTKQWLHHYTASISGSARDRALIRHFRFAGLMKYNFPLIIEILPILLHISLALFLIGLSAFLRNLHITMFSIVAGISGLSYALYLVSIVLALLDPQCPYQTPLSFYVYRVVYSASRAWASCRSSAETFWRLFNNPTKSHVTHPHPKQTQREEAFTSFADLEMDAVATYKHLGLEAVCWLYKSSVNSTVKNILLESLGGFPPIPLPTTLVQTVDKMINADLYAFIRACSDPDDQHPIPRPGLENKHDRLLRAICFTNGADLPEQIVSLSIWDLQGAEWEDPRLVFGRRVLPFLERERSGETVANLFPLGQQSDSSFPPSIWSTLLQLAWKRWPTDQDIKVGIVGTGFLSPKFPVSDAVMGSVSLSTALENRSIRVLALQYLGLSERDAEDWSNLLRVLRDAQHYLMGAALNIEAQPFLLAIVHVVADLTPNGIRDLLATDYDGVMERDVVRDFLDWNRERELEWKDLYSMIQIVKRSTAEGFALRLSEAPLISRVLEQFSGIGQATRGSDHRWIKRTADMLPPLLDNTLSSPLAGHLCGEIQRLEMLPESRDLSRILSWFWSPQATAIFIISTCELPKPNMLWVHVWLAYIHTPEHLFFLSKRCIPLLDFFPDAVEHLCQIDPKNAHWPTVMKNLLDLFRDDQFLESMEDELDNRIENPRQQLSEQLTKMKHVLVAHHDLSSPEYNIPVSTGDVEEDPTVSPESSASVNPFKFAKLVLDWKALGKKKTRTATSQAELGQAEPAVVTPASIEVNEVAVE